MPTPLTFNWSEFSGDVSGGVTQDTGGINVAVSYVENVDDEVNGVNPTSTSATISSSSQFVDTSAGETFAENSSLNLRGPGGAGDTSITTLDFSATSGSGFSDEVDNVTFRINDFDTGTWIDVVSVRAFDADGNPINVDLDWNGQSFSGTNTTITSDVSNGVASTETGSILVEIAGPVAKIEIDYNNNAAGGQALWVTDIHFDAVDLPDGTVEGTSGDDIIDADYTDDPERDMVDNNDAILAGDTGDDDLIFGFAGDDEISAGLGDDEVFGGTGSDTINISANEGSDTIEGGEDGSGNDIDTLNFSDSAGSTGVNVRLRGDEEGEYNFPTDGGDGTFSEIEEFSLTDQADTFDGAAASSGATVFAGAGQDTVIGSSGDDILFGGEGNDQLVLEDSFGDDRIEGGETGETLGDVLDASAVTSDLSLDLTAVSSTDGESGTLSDGTSTATFEEIERVLLGSGDDRVAGSSGSENVDGGEGADTFNLGAGNDTVDLGSAALSTSPDGDADVINLQDGSGDDIVLNFDAPTLDVGSNFVGVDTFDVSNLNDADGVPVNTNDVTVSDDGAGNAVLTFPNGESVTLQGIAPADADNPFYLNAIGIPLPDGTVSGTDGADTIDGNYLGDPDGDIVDNGDAIIPGDVNDDDLIEAGAGNDTIFAGDGDDVVFAEEGDDTVEGGDGDDVIFGDSGAEVSAVVNGDFSAGGDGWSGFDTEFNPEGVYQGNGSDNGVTEINGGANQITVLEQDVTVSSAGTATLSFDGVLRAGDSRTTVDVDGYTVEISDDTGTVIFSETVFPQSKSDWETFEFEINFPTDGTYTLSFTEVGESDARGALLDNVAIETGAGDDDLSGGAGDDTLFGHSGDDALDGGTDDDVIFGGSGSDEINVSAGEGTDTIEGSEDADGNDIDVLTFTDGAGIEGVDVTLTASETGTYTFPTDGGDGTFSEIEEFNLTEQDDTFDGTLATEATTVDANAGDDTIIGGAGEDVLTGGADDDVIFGGAGDVVDGSETGTDNDTLVVADVDFIDFDSANSENGTVHFNDGSTLAFTNIENVVTSDGTVSGTNGSDLIDTSYTGDPDGDFVDNNDAILPGDTGDDDLIIAGGGNDTVFAGAGNDEVFGGFGRDTIFGGDGDDILFEGSTGGAQGTLFGGAGNDTLYTGTGSANDELYGGDDNDTLIDQGNESANDTLAGGAGDDIVTAGLGNDIVLVAENDGTDTITGGEDVDGLDVDTLDFSDGSGPDGVDVTLTGDEAGDYTFAGDDADGTFVEIENLDLTAQNDTFDGTLATGGSTVDAGAGDDTLTGGTGADDLDGDAGDDTFIVNDGFGDDTIEGGETGETNGDTIDGSALTENVVVDFSGPEAGTLTNGADTATFAEIEEIATGSGDDTVLGDSGDDVVTTNDGDDVVFGGAGDDTFETGADDDSLTGGTGADSLFAGSGDDTITFAEGDTADGDAGDDLFVLENLGETGNGTITIDGGAGDELGGDTLQLGDLGVLTNEVKDSFVDDGTGSFSGSITLDDGTILNFSEIENIICFTPDTRIATPKGMVAIQDLQIGDLVVTRDHGLQPIRWLESRTVPAIDRFAPVRIRKNVLAGQERDLIVSPQHRVLFQGYRAELLFGESEVLVSAKHLVDGMDVTQDEQHMVTYIHMMFDRHEVIYAEGAATESFHPGDIGMNAVSDAAREELFAIFPELRADQSVYGNTARKCLKSHEAKLIRM